MSGLPADRVRPRRRAKADKAALEAYELWMEGATYREVAAQMGATVSTTYERVRRGGLLLRGDVEDKRDRIAEEHRADMTALRQIGEDYEVEASARVSAYNARRGHAERLAKLYGLDAPVKTDVTSGGEKITLQVVKDWAGEEQEEEE